MQKLMFVRSEYEYCLYTRTTGKGKMYVLLYIDDLLLASEDERDIEFVKKMLSERFKMEDLGMIRHYFGMFVVQNSEKGEIMINQTIYLEKLLEKCNMLECKPVSTPMEENFDHI